MNRSHKQMLALWCGCLLMAGIYPSHTHAAMGQADAFIGEEVPANIQRMYERGLTYLARTQQPDGVWPNAGGQTGSGIQGLALMALIADGSDPRFGPYAGQIQRGLNALLAMQAENGYFGNSMYHHGFATLALAELYGTLDDERIGPALLRAVDLIQEAQNLNHDGAWRYSPHPSGADTTVSGGVLVSLFAARNAGMEVPDEAIDRALAFIHSCQDASGGIGYTSAGSGSGARNAIGVLVASLANQSQTPFARSAFNWLRNHDESVGGSYYFYYLYYASQAYFRADMREWRRWNQQIATILASTQNAEGGWDGPHGSTFCTSAAMLTMALNYRYLPIYER